MNPANMIAFTMEKDVRVSEEAVETLRAQMEFYLSSLNLLTDRFLRNIIIHSRGGWVKIQVFLEFTKINLIFDRLMGEFNLSPLQKRTILRQSCRRSQRLIVKDVLVTRRGNYSNIYRFGNCLYIQGPQNQDRIRNELIGIGVDCSRVKMRSSHTCSWHIAHFQGVREDQVAKIRIALMEKCKVLQWKIIDGNQFLRLEEQYNNLVGIQKLNTYLNKGQAQYKFPTERMLSFEDIKESRVEGKERKVEDKSRLNKTRLPKKYIFFKGKRRPDRPSQKFKMNIVYPQRKNVKSPQQQRQYEKRKIIEKRARKQNKMQILKDPFRQEKVRGDQEKMREDHFHGVTKMVIESQMGALRLDSENEGMRDE